MIGIDQVELRERHVGRTDKYMLLVLHNAVDFTEGEKIIIKVLEAVIAKNQFDTVVIEGQAVAV